MLVADIHAHVFPGPLASKASASIGGFYGAETRHVASLENLQVRLEAAGISYAAVSSSATSPSQVDHINSFLSRCAKENPNLVAFGTLFPTMEGWEAVLEKMPEQGIRGIKIHPDFQQIPIDAPEAIDMYRAIAKAGLPILFHMGDARYDYSSPQRLTNLIGQVPDLVAIAAHFGGWQSWDRAYQCVLPENVYYDTSSSLMFLGKERGLDFLDHMGPNRFLFGSDFPMWDPKDELERFLCLQLDQETQNRILYGNFARLFL